MGGGQLAREPERPPVAIYIACPSDNAAVLIDCLPSPCTRLSRAPTTTKAPSLGRVIAGLGGLPDYSGARLEVPAFKKKALNALGGRLYPWQYRPCLLRGWDTTHRTEPAHETVIQAIPFSLQDPVRAPGSFPYRGFRHRLQRACQLTRVLHHGICGSLRQRDLHPSSQTVNAARLLQSVVPTSTEFAAPLLT